MSPNASFIDKLIRRLDRLDPESLQAHVMRMARERGLLEMIFQSIQEGVLVVGGAGRIDYANRAAEHLLGFTLESAQGRPVSRFLRAIDWDRILALDAEAWSRLVSQEIEITYPEHRFLSFYIVPLEEADENERGALVILRDVTRDRKEEDQVLESERLNAIKLLAAGVAHEIGNPLNALNIHLQLLDREIRSLRKSRERDDDTDLTSDLDSLHELTETARSEVARLDMIITQFLRAIRPSQPRLAPCRIEALLEEALTLLRHEVENRRIDIEIERPKTLPEIPADANQIKQAFFNIIRNAFQAMADGGHLDITLSITNDSLVIAFRDSGKGIAREALGQVFEPYHSTRPEGSGLGLMIVQRIVQDHGGRIEITSKPDVGTTVTILLPLTERPVRLLRAREARGNSAGANEGSLISEEVETT